jgi:xylulose-5-phosphate/fructose-6-phosphate phosphoketolase
MSEKYRLVEAFQEAAVHVSLLLTYLRSNLDLAAPLRPADVRERPLGHIGCSPGVAYTWACALGASVAEGRALRLLAGTGHAGPIWLGCALLEGNLPVGLDGGGPALARLPELAARFGAQGGIPTELCAAYPGVLWPSGELGHAAAVGRGHALADREEATVVLLGDGELEAGSTLQALCHAGLAGGAPVVFVVNDNGLRMGGPSLFGGLSREEQERFFAGLGLPCAHLELGDCRGVEELRRALWEPGQSSVLVVRGAKGAGCPPLPGGEPVAGTLRSHKAPLPAAGWDAAGLAWLEEWLRATQPEWLPGAIAGEGEGIEGRLPPPQLRLSRPGAAARRPRRALPPQPSRPGATGVAAFASLLEAAAGTERVVLTSPDELASNRLGQLAGSRVEVVEVLNEQLCIGITIGAAAAGTATWHAAYEAFAQLVSSPLSQFLKHLDQVRAESLSPPRTVGVLLTSLGWRNVPSHRDHGIVSSLLATRSPSLRLRAPICAESLAAAVEESIATDGLLSLLVVDKSIPLREETQPVAPGLRSVGPLPDPPPGPLLLVVGDVVVREAERAAQCCRAVPGTPAPSVLALEDLTLLYREDEEARSCREHLRDLCADAAEVLIAAPFAGPLAIEWLSALAGPRAQSLHPFAHHPDAAPGCGTLLRAGCCWPQLLQWALSSATGQEAQQARTTAATEIGRLERQLPIDPDLDWHQSIPPRPGPVD